MTAIRNGTATLGTVTLVGAGPGDAGLLTLHGLRALERADVIVADRLGARAVLDQLAAEGVELRAEVIDVGKTPGHHPVPQEEINALIVRHARAGREVVRLKGGDPFVLGRGREESLYCEAEGIAVRVVPGVTSAISVPAVAGIPLTHRNVATAFTVASAHDPIEQLPGGSDHTVVLLMGIGTLGHTAGVLARGARGADCPVAIVEDGYGSGERVTVGTLGDIAALAAVRKVRNPAVVVVGDVVRLSPHAAHLRDRETETTSRDRTNHPRSRAVGSVSRSMAAARATTSTRSDRKTLQP
ncbi:uroporphyrinogen-III C-methyltransferase [Microbacterium capsulatum]|uniref:uroporphyrinogen-III C-methyltransferase n=1 Tax=Microbacterium capsulatum TaxID=3041921 RepID=A0ABU0XJY2_9MICO|nr:uroporphyrinogen-III C-methyltransferase [Microbacterium sp. ASV81]MDQ4214954.1 uroporphyrinogen-III C-methyltransferase [Microbacterium sp. ASV81]